MHHEVLVLSATVFGQPLRCSWQHSACLFLQEVLQRGKVSVMTQPDSDDPLRESYGDAPLVQSRTPSGITRTRIQDISTALDGQLVPPLTIT